MKPGYAGIEEELTRLRAEVKAQEKHIMSLEGQLARKASKDLVSRRRYNTYMRKYMRLYRKRRRKKAA